MALVATTLSGLQSAAWNVASRAILRSTSRTRRHVSCVIREDSLDEVDRSSLGCIRRGEKRVKPPLGERSGDLCFAPLCSCCTVVALHCLHAHHRDACSEGEREQQHGLSCNCGRCTRISRSSADGELGRLEAGRRIRRSAIGQQPASG